MQQLKFSIFFFTVTLMYEVICLKVGHELKSDKLYFFSAADQEDF